MAGSAQACFVGGVSAEGSVINIENLDLAEGIMGAVSLIIDGIAGAAEMRSGRWWRGVKKTLPSS